MRCSDSFLPLNEKAEVRAATRKSGVGASALRISSVIPSQKYSLSLSGLIVTNGSTAMDFWSAVPVAAGAAPEALVKEVRTAFAEEDSLSFRYNPNFRNKTALRVTTNRTSTASSFRLLLADSDMTAPPSTSL